MLVSNRAWLLAISTWRPPRSLAWQKGSRLDSGLTLKLLGLLLLVGSLGLPVSAHPTLLVGPEETSWWAALVLLLRFVCIVQEDRWILPHLAVRTHFECSRWVSRVSQPVQRTPLWPASWLPVLDKSRGKSAEIQRVWGIYDDRLKFMTRDDALGLDGALEDGDVSHAWSIWLSAAEAALADAYQFSGGPVPDRGLVLGRFAFLVRTVRLGGPEVRKARRNFADPVEG